MSAPERPASGELSLRKLSLEELDNVVGGATTAAPNPHQFDKVAGFDTSQLHLDAAAMTSGQAEADVAHAVQAGQATTAQGMHLLEAVAAADHTSVTQALSNFAGQVSALPGHASDGYVVGGEIGHLISLGHVTPAQAMADIGAAVTAQSLTTDQAVSVLAGIAASGSSTLQATVGGEIAALVNAHQIDASAAMNDIHGAVAADHLTGAQAIAMLASVAGHGDAALQAAAGGEIAALIATQQITDRATMTGITSAVTAHHLTGNRR